MIFERKDWVWIKYEKQVYYALRNLLWAKINSHFNSEMNEVLTNYILTNYFSKIRQILQTTNEWMNIFQTDSSIERVFQIKNFYN
jgi:hypothetical protein